MTKHVDITQQKAVRHTNFSTKRKKISLIMLGDIHFGASPCLEDEFEKVVKYIQKHKDTYWVGMGDYMEIATRMSPGKSLYHQIRSPSDQHYYVRQQFEKIKGRCLGLHSGNHENRLVKSDNYCMTFFLAQELGVPYLTSHATHTIKIEDREWDVLTTHGRTGATTEEGKRKVIKKLMNIYDADIYGYGHTHLLDEFPKRKYYRGEPKDIHLCLTGSFMDYLDSYGEESEYEPMYPGYLILDIYKDRIRGRKKYIY